MKPLLQLFLLFLSIQTFALPYISPEVAQEVLTRDYAGQTLYWMPTDLPMTLDVNDNSSTANHLVELFDQGLVERDRVLTTKDLGNGRKKVVLRWRYFWPDAEQQGVPYGVRRFHSIMALTEPIQQDGIWYVEVRMRWWVDNMPEWASAAEFRQARVIRRSRESYEKPFEATLILELQDNRWQLWQPESR